MTYATLENLTERYGADMLLGITDRATPPAGAIDTVVVARALANADATINGRLGTRFVVPLAETPPEIREIAEAIAIWKLHVYKPDEKIEADYKEAMKTLEGMAAGSVVLHATTLAPVETGGTGARLTDRDRPLTAENLRGYI